MNKLFASTIIFVTLIGGLLFGSLPVFAQDYGLSNTAKSAGLANETDLPTMIGNIIGTALSLISVLFFGLILYAGFLWMTSRGNPEQEKKAKETIFGATIGIIIILAAYAITSFVFTKLGPGGSGSNSSSASSKLLDTGALCTADNQCAKGGCYKLAANNGTNFCDPDGARDLFSLESNSNINVCTKEADCANGLTCSNDYFPDGKGICGKKL